MRQKKEINLKLYPTARGLTAVIGVQEADKPGNIVGPRLKDLGKRSTRTHYLRLPM